MLSRKLTKRILSIAGATIILGTFLAKDWRKDKLKELADSINTAENTYIIRMSNSKIYAEIKDVMSELTGFEDEYDKDHHRDSNNSRSTPGAINWGKALVLLRGLVRDNDELVDAVAKLAEKLHSNAHRDELKKLVADNDTLRSQLDEVDRLEDSFANDDRDHSSVLNQHVMSLGQGFDSIETRTNTLVKTILDDSEAERRNDERKYEYWKNIYYALFATGWIISMAGILIGRDEERTVVEELAEG
jgi:hypothetical protein